MASRWLAFDKTLLITTLGLLGLGLLMVYSASFPASHQRWGHGMHYLLQQSFAATIGIMVLVTALMIDYRAYRRPLIIGSAVLGTMALLLLVLTSPPSAGVRRWILLGGFSVQPSEIAKIVVVLFLASYLARNEDRIDQFWQGLMPGFVVVGFIVLLIAIEPDLGTATVVLATAGLMFWVAGLSKTHLLRLSAIALLAGGVQVLRSAYQARRIAAFINPWADPGGAGFQSIQSMIAVGSGGLTGTGLAEGKQKLFFLPQPYTDFVYAVLAEELGLIGALSVVAAFMIILWRGMRAANRAPDRFGFYLGVGLTGFLVLQAIVNMSVVVNLLPTTGIPLPLVSFGGSSLVICCASIGVLLNLSQHP